MNHPTSISALIPAAGLGTRLGRGPKALLRLQGQTIIERLVETLLPLVDHIVVAAPREFHAEFAGLLHGRATVIGGGETRQESVAALLAASDGELVLIQDAARPFASPALFAAVLDAARRHGAAGAFLDPSVPVGILRDGAVSAYLSRQDAGIFQAPQAFHRELLLAAHSSNEGMAFQSTAQMVIDAGYALQAIPGEAENIKITTELDWRIAEHVIAPGETRNRIA